ncbi:MAG: type II secretion system protein M [Burkholderiales bacterium]|jgi:type II secretory pathway component PulM|nr:type II secretion system protein M [Burkholderiales bacterium]
MNRTDLMRQLGNRFEELNAREQKLVKFLFATVVLTLVWLIAVEPALQTSLRGGQMLADKQVLTARVLALSKEIVSIKNQGVSATVEQGQPREQLESRLALMQWLEKSRITEKSEGQFSVEVSGLPAADALEWLDATERTSGLTLSSVTLNKVSTGTVDMVAVWGQRLKP